jgi:two-component system sensor histidine kinase AtoS
MATDSTSQLPVWRRPRWLYAAGGFLLGVLYTAAALALGFEFRLGAADLTLLGGAVVEFSFAGFGFLLGLVTEARRREAVAARVVATQLRELGGIRARLAQAEKLATLGELAGAISHELRNPLAILRSMAQNLEETIEGEARATCRALLEEIDRLTRVTARLVDFARPVVPRKRALTAAGVGRRVALLAGELLRQHPVRLAVRPGEDGAFRGDEDLLCQMLLGLLENAAQVSPQGGEIELSWGVDGEGRGVEFRVTDTGPGVPSELRQQIFEPFFTTRPEGHGLGLAVARQIVEAHGGQLTVEVADEAGGGAVFRAVLPTAASLESAP